MFNAGIVSKQDVETRGDEAFSADPVTSGPYRVAEWRPNDRLVLAANPHYWREGYPKNDGAELIEVASETTRVAMMQAGELDAAREIPWSQINELHARTDIEMPLEPSTVIFMTLLNHDRLPFDDLRIRQAAAHALDTAAITRAMTFDHATPANITLPGALDFHHTAFDGLTYDPDAARALLQEADRDDRELVILITDNPQNEKMAVLMQALWGEVGLRAKIEKVDGGSWWQRVPGGDYDAAPTWWYNETTDPDLAVRWALCGSCGNRSFRYRLPVGQLILDFLPRTLFLLAYVLMLSLPATIALAIAAARSQGRWPDLLIRGLAVCGMTIPVFWLGIMLSRLFGVELGWFPVSGYGDTLLERLHHLFLPALSTAIWLVPILVRNLRAALIEQMEADYVIASRSKGLPEGYLFTRHILMNSILPTLHLLGVIVAYLIGGSVIVEIVYAVPGLGSLMIGAVIARDIHLVQGLTLVYALGTVLVMLTVDIVSTLIDPRIEP